MKEKTEEKTQYKSKIHYLDRILQELNKSYENRQNTALKTLRTTLTDAQNDLLSELLQLYKTKEQKIVYRSYMEGFKKGLRIGLNYSKIN